MSSAADDYCTLSCSGSRFCSLCSLILPSTRCTCSCSPPSSPSLIPSSAPSVLGPFVAWISLALSTFQRMATFLSTGATSRSWWFSPVPGPSFFSWGTFWLWKSYWSPSMTWFIPCQFLPNALPCFCVLGRVGQQQQFWDPSCRHFICRSTRGISWTFGSRWKSRSIAPSKKLIIWGRGIVV